MGTSTTTEKMAEFRKRLARRTRAPGQGLESLSTTEVPLRDAEIPDRTEQSREHLAKFIERYYGKDAKRQALADQIVQEGGEALRRLLGDDATTFEAKPAIFSALEAIVRTDGSRPSFLVREGEPDEESSPLGSWGDRLFVRRNELKNAIAKVGRINAPHAPAGYAGTGFLLAPRLVLTNRHVLQEIATFQNEAWQLFPNVTIDFGHEFQSRDTINRRKLSKVLFAGSQAIDGYAIDHAKLDLALIELDSDAGDGASFLLQLQPPAWRNIGDIVFTIGYPYRPPEDVYKPSLVEQLFGTTFGFKRLAPGEIIQSNESSEQWTVAHDATTLGGNSGSVILAFGNEGVAAGLHYGGRSAAPGENWGHQLEHVLEHKNGDSAATLREVLEQHGVMIAGKPSAPPKPPPVVPKPPEPPPVVAKPPAPVTGSRPYRAKPEEAPKPPTGPAPDWRQGVTLKMMKMLGACPGVEDAEASPNARTPAERFQDRGGYQPSFIDGFAIPLPLSTRGDMRSLRRGGTGVELKYEHFSVVMSVSRRMAMMTACNINGRESRRVSRSGSWKYDGRLDPGDQWGNELYAGNDLDRGHMVRREDPIWGSPAVARQANLDTFHYTNSCPQMGVVNQQTWLGLEDFVLDHTREDEMRVSVFTGPFFTPNDLSFRGALIPRAFWKIVAFVTDDGRPSATAYKVSQDRELRDLEFVFAGYKTFQISVRQVADATGLDLSAMIPFDGFSQHERAHGTTLVERVERFDQIRV